MAGQGQAPAPANADDNAKALRARRIARQFERNATVLTVFDRHGKVVARVGERAGYSLGAQAFSPDRTRLVVSKRDLENRTWDIWVLEVATGKSTRITSSQSREQARWPVWSPDGSQIAYVALRRSYQGVYRKAANGEGPEELLYQYPGANLILEDWTADGGF